MSWDMIMRLPIQDRRSLIHKHNIEQGEINKQIEDNSGGDIRKYEGEQINTFARLEQDNRKKR